MVGSVINKKTPTKSAPGIRLRIPRKQTRSRKCDVKECHAKSPVDHSQKIQSLIRKMVLLAALCAAATGCSLTQCHVSTRWTDGNPSIQTKTGSIPSRLSVLPPSLTTKSPFPVAVALAAALSVPDNGPHDVLTKHQCTKITVLLPSRITMITSREINH